MTTTPAPARAHNYACEHAADAQCRCFCHGAGHQSDLVARAAGCANSADKSSLSDDLERVYGGFRPTARDVAARPRPGRWTPLAPDAAIISQDKRRGASWFEAALVDEALHAAFIAVTDESLSTTDAQRAKRVDYVDRLTRGALHLMPATGSISRVAEAHVWCSIIAEYASSLVTPSAAHPHPQRFDVICYPRLKRGTRPVALSRLQAGGLNHVDSEYNATTLPDDEAVRLLHLVGAATCPDLWHHPAAVRFSLEPFVKSTGWPPARSTKIATRANFRNLRERWDSRGNW